MKRSGIIRFPGALEAAVALGRRLVRLGCDVVIRYPGAWVWDGREHLFHPAVGFIATHRAWALGEEPMSALPDADCFPAVPGVVDADTFPAMELDAA